MLVFDAIQTIEFACEGLCREFKVVETIDP